MQIGSENVHLKSKDKLINDALLLFMNMDMVYSKNLYNLTRLNTIKGYQFWYPIVFRLVIIFNIYQLKLKKVSYIFCVCVPLKNIIEN